MSVNSKRGKMNRLHQVGPSRRKKPYLRNKLCLSRSVVQDRAKFKTRVLTVCGVCGVTGRTQGRELPYRCLEGSF